MSIPPGYQGLRVDRGEIIANKTQNNFSQSGDDNANQLSLATDQKGRGLIEYLETSPSSIPPLVSQSGTSSSDNLVIWGTGLELQQYECQDVEAFLGGCDQERENDEEDDDATSFRDGRDEGPMSISSSSTASSASVGVKRNENDSNKVEGQRSKEAQARIASQSFEELDSCVTASEEKRDTRLGRGGDRERRKGGLKESKSETNVFVPSLSAVSFSGSLSSDLDSRREMPSFITLSSRSKSSHHSDTSAQTRQRGASVDASQTSPPSNPQERSTQKSCEDLRQEGSHHRNRLSSDGGLGQRRKAGFEERVMPPRRQQLVRPLCQTEIVRARSLVETSVQQVDSMKTDSSSNGSSRKLIKSALREPSDFSALYSTPGIAQPRQPNQTTQKETLPREKQPDAAACRNFSTTNPSTLEKRSQPQLTYRRNCSSPNRMGFDSRSSTPPQSPLRTPQGSPHRQPSMYLVSRTISGVARQIPQGCNPNVTALAQGNGSSCMRAPVKTNISTTGIPKAPLSNQQSSNHNSGPKDSSASPKPKPKGVRPKIITYVRKNPQFKPQVSDGPYQVSSLPSRLSAYAHGQTAPSAKEGPKDSSKAPADARGAPVLSASNLLYDKYRQGMQTNIFPPGVLNRGIRPPLGHTHTVPPSHLHSHTAPPKLGSRAENFYGARAEVDRSDEALQPQTAAQAGGSGSLLRSGRGMRLGLGAVTRSASGSAKGKVPGQGQKPGVFSQPIEPVSTAANQKSQEDADEVFIAAPVATAAAQPQTAASRSLLPKSSQSGLRPPGYSSSSRGTAASRLAAFGFVRSSSVSSVGSAHSADSTQSDPCRTAHRLSVSEEPPLHRVATAPPPAHHHQRGYSLQPPSTPALPRRFLPAQPRSSPGAGRKEFQRSSEVARSLPSSPKRLAVVPPKPQSPVQSVQRAAASPGSPRRVAPLRLQQESLQQESLQKEKEEAQQKERERQAEELQKEEQREEVQRLQGRCELQERQLSTLREELRRTTLGLEAFIVTSQHYCLKNTTAEENQVRLSAEMRNIKEEMVCNVARWERLHREKAALEVAFERELQELQLQQEAELAAVEASLRKCHLVEAEHLKAEHRAEMEELRAQQQEQVEELTVSHQAATQELRDMHNITMATLHEEHARTMRDLRKAHEQQKALLEEDFEKLRLSLQDQVDTLTFQNQSLKEKAKRFEEALRRSTDEQIVEALAPYQHIEQDLKSLKEVVEMKNQQIHQQEKKITDLEKVAQKNVFLEERVQVLQQQNEDLLARIQMNLAISRQLSEENANLQESVEKESTEKKRLSMNNEELLWRLQTSPLMSPASSPLHRSFSTSPVPSSPFFPSSSCPSPAARCDSPTHCQGCSQTPQYSSASHRAGANQNLSSSPATPTHRAAGNLNYSPGPATPTHRASANRCNPAACLSSLQR